MIYVAYIITVVSALAAGTFLIINDHPWFGAIAFLMAAFCGVKSKDDAK